MIIFRLYCNIIVSKSCVQRIAKCSKLFLKFFSNMLNQEQIILFYWTKGTNEYYLIIQSSDAKMFHMESKFMQNLKYNIHRVRSFVIIIIL